jgi:hypothetical protein
VFDQIQDNAAHAVLKTFRLSGSSYFYEDRLSGERVEMPDTVEVPIEFVTDDPATGITVTKKGRRFLITRATKEQIDVFRLALERNIAEQPTPWRGDFIIVIKNGIETKYQIDTRDPYSVIGSNNAVYQINTFLV